MLGDVNESYPFRSVDTSPQIQPMILRGIAWAAKWPVEALLPMRQPQGRGRGGRGGA